MPINGGIARDFFKDVFIGGEKFFERRIFPDKSKNICGKVVGRNHGVNKFSGRAVGG